MESTDAKILSLLARDGRMSYTDLGRATGLSTSAAQQRVRRLEQRGVISGYRAVINPEAVGRMLTAFVSLRSVDPMNDNEVPQRLASIDEVVSCYTVAGEASHVLIVPAETPVHLEQVINSIRTMAGVSTPTQVVLSVPYADRPPV